MGKIFGTDGARGIAGKELTVELAMAIGRSTAIILTEELGRRPTFVIGKDTRISSDMLEAAVTAGICSVGADVISLGVIPTPAVAYLAGYYGADSGVVLTASHNLFEFNGMKLFGSTGYKLTDEEEERIETLIFDHVPYVPAFGENIGHVRVIESAHTDYVKYIAARADGDFSGLRVLADCAEGSASTTAGELFSLLGLDATLIHNTPNGVNINDRCGSTHIEFLAEKVVSGGYDMGFAFDGDADRFFAVDEKGNILDGDFLMAIFADYLRKRGELKKDTIVVTSMTNMGFLRFAKDNGYHCETTIVGDRYVLDCMRAEGYNLGGEQSGHITFLDHMPTGDGQLSAVMLLNAVKAAGCPLSKLGTLMKRYPQVLKGVLATPEMKAAYSEHPAIIAAIESQTRLLGDRGRVVVRPSGTEPLIRVMIEGENLDEIEHAVQMIIDAIEVSR